MPRWSDLTGYFYTHFYWKTIQYYSQCGGLRKVDTENGEENSPPLGGPGSFDQPVCSCLPMGHLTYMRGAGSPVAFIICNQLKKAIGIRNLTRETHECVSQPKH